MLWARKLQIIPRLCYAPNGFARSRNKHRSRDKYMGKDDHYIFMDGCIVKGCKPVLNFEHTFGEYSYLLEELFRRGGWGHGEKGFWGFRKGGANFDDWVSTHVHMAQSTQNKRTGASRVDELLRGISGHGHIHLFGTSAAGAALLEYMLLTDPRTLYYRPSDPHGDLRPPKRYDIDPRIASLTTIDAPTNWVPVRHDDGLRKWSWGAGILGEYLDHHTRVKAGPHYLKGEHATRTEDVPDTWVEAHPVAGLDYDDRPHYDNLPEPGMKRHMYTGNHISHETRDFLHRVWR
jgi:hypothetical protein